MEQLPLELQQEICSWLLPLTSLTTTQAPISSKLERINVYHFRLVCRSLRSGASAAFVKIVGDIPTKCTDQSLFRLKSLVLLPQIGKDITHLTFNTCKLSFEKSTSKETFQWLKSKRRQWIRRHLRASLATILS
jgi:hypothetical protein